TRSYGDWSSDVCSSDLGALAIVCLSYVQHRRYTQHPSSPSLVAYYKYLYLIIVWLNHYDQFLFICRSSASRRVRRSRTLPEVLRSEERRVGKEWGSRVG